MVGPVTKNRKIGILIEPGKDQTLEKILINASFTVSS